MRVCSTVRGRLSGRVTVVEVALGGAQRTLFDSKNSITDAAEEVFRGFLARQFEDKMIATIAIGSGGDLEADPPHNPTGSRVAPEPQEQEVRQLVAEVPIQLVQESGDSVIYTAVAGRYDANSPDINEFGLLSRDGTLFAHFVTEADPGPGAKKVPKTDLSNWIITWEIEYTNA